MSVINDGKDEHTMITIQIETITPEVAKEYLNHNVRNIRSVNPNVVKKYATSMRNGTFEQNGESIKFYENGDLFDGQHRLKAIIDSGTTQMFVVVRGISNDVTVTDVGAARSVLCLANSMGGTCNSNVLAAASIMCRGFDNISKSNTPKEDIARYAVQHEDLLKLASSLSTTGKRGGILKKGYAIALFYCYLRLNDSSLETIAKIERFAYCINTGFYENPLETSAIVIRNYLSDNKYIAGQVCNYVGLMSVLDQAYNSFQKNPRKRPFVPNDDIVGFVQTVRHMDGIIDKEDI